MNRRELATKVGVIRALKKAVIAAEKEAETDLRRMVEEAYAEDGISRFEILIGDVEVGRIFRSAPKVGVYEGPEFPKWAYDHGMGRHLIVIDCDDMGEGGVFDLKERLGESWVPYTETYEARPEARKQLKVMGGHVVDAEGEVVPGTYPKYEKPRVTGCKPAEVGAAMQALGSPITIAGFLEGGADDE